MQDTLNTTQRQEPETRDGTTLGEMLVIVAVLAVFASVYTYVVFGAITSNSLPLTF